MSDYLCKHTGDYYLASGFTAHQLDTETLHGPLNLYYAMSIKTGTGSTTDISGMDNMYRWATVDGWRVIYYPHAGGSEAYVKVDGIGWVVDTEDEMPHSVWIVLLTLLGAPVTASASS